MSIWAVLSGAMPQEMRMDVLSNNLANVNTTGFKKDRLIFEGLTPIRRETLPAESSKETVPTFAVMTQILSDFEPGAIRDTANPLNLAIEGEGFFAIQTPDGVRYTRDGNFTQDVQGQMVTRQGFPLLGDGGAIILPAGTVTIGREGKISVGTTEVASLATFDVSDERFLKKAGSSLYELSGGATATPSTDVRVLQGALEQSNVNPVQEMVTMISVMRSYEAAQRAILTSTEIAAKMANEVARIA